MREKGYKQFRLHLLSLFADWSEVLNLTDLRFMVPESPKTGQDSLSVYARFPYKRVWVWWSRRDYLAWKQGYDFNPDVLHECLHVILWELGRKMPARQKFRIEESTTDHLANVIFKLHGSPR